MRFRFEGKEYDEVDNPVFGEIAYIERKLKQDVEDWTGTTRAFASFFISIRRTDPGLVTWDRMINDLGPDDFEVLPEAEQEPDPQLPPESEWPLDPTGAGIPTGVPSGSGPNSHPPGDSTYQDFGQNTYSPSGSNSDSPPPSSTL
jgi:hypothetical protein